MDWRITGLLASGSIPAALATIWALSLLPKQSAQTTHVISLALGIALLLTACAIVLRHRLQHFALRHADDAVHTRHAAPITIATGVVLGVLVRTVSSVGAGALGILVLFLYPRLPPSAIDRQRYPRRAAALVAGAGHWAIGSVDTTLLGSLLLGSLPGIWLGSHASARVPERVLRPLLAGMLLLVGGKLISI